MKSKIKIKIGIDIAMTILLLLLMSYELIGQSTHEWIGMIMFLLFITHHIFNQQWIRNQRKAKWSVVRIWQIFLVIWVLVTMIGSMISGMILSRTVFSFLPIIHGQGKARILHLLCAYWGFVGMSLHLGYHWKMMMTVASKNFKAKSDKYTWLLRILAIMIAGYGIYAFIKQDIASYMFLENMFVFFDYSKPTIYFFIDYVAIMGLFVCIGHYVSKGIYKINA